MQEEAALTTQAVPSPSDPAELPERIVLFDGECAVCDASVQWIRDHDPERRFHFAPLQGPTAAAILARHPELPADLDSLVLVHRRDGDESVAWYTDAVLGIASELPGIWSYAGWLRVVPAVLRDPAYRVFAAVRYRVFGRLDQCRLPTPEEAHLFLA